MPFKSKCIIDDIGRECSKCFEYKKWYSYSRDNSKYAIRWKTSNCKKCRNKIKREYRNNNWYTVDRLYKQLNRTLYIWDIISYDNEEYKVVSYKYKQWYKAYNGKVFINIDTSDNKNKKIFTIIKTSMEIHKDLKIQRVGRQIIWLSKMTKVEKYYKIIDILTQFYDDNILTDTKDSKIAHETCTEEKE